MKEDKTANQPPSLLEIEALRATIFRAKAHRRFALRQAPIEEKFRMLEEMRDFSSLLRPLREQHRAKVKSAWKQP